MTEPSDLRCALHGTKTHPAPNQGRRMNEEDIIAPGRLEFPSGHSIDVHTVRNGQVYYQVWHPGVETQSVFDCLIRKPIAEFIAQVREHKGARIEGPHG